MYIEYDRNQLEVLHKDAGCLIIRGIKDPIHSKVRNEFKPTSLVRVSDMKVVPGSFVNQHYWALSYSWNQSGKLIHKGGEEYERIDEGRHTIVSPYKVLSDDKSKKDRFGGPSKKVKFEELIQQICIDFNIKYLWFDQMCIDQDNHDAKMDEIRQMHLIYRYARCTLALVPEMDFTVHRYSVNITAVPNSQWCKRMWTLEEAYMSKNILFLGRNVHVWSNVLYIWRAHRFNQQKHFGRNLSQPRKWKACTALWFARKRTSSKAHDRIFALVNIFPEMQDWVAFNYDQPAFDLMNQFYSRLAQEDVSVLLFGAPRDPDPDDEVTAARQKDANILPSWTGASGIHIPQYFFRDELTVMTFGHTITGGLMNVASSYVTVRIVEEASLGKNKSNGHLYNGRMHTEYTEDDLSWRRCYGNFRIAENESIGLTFTATTSERNSYDARYYGVKTTHLLPIKVKDEFVINTLSGPTHSGGFLSLTEQCSECIIVFGIAFRAKLHHRFYPVIKKCDDHYKSIGVCFLFRNISFESIVEQEQSFNIK